MVSGSFTFNYVLTMARNSHFTKINSPGNLGELALLTADHVTAMLAYWDKNLICRYANNAYVEWFGRTKEEMINKIHIQALLGPLYEKNIHYIKGALSGRKQLFEREIPIPGGAGLRHSLATYIPDIRDEEVLGFFVHVADVTYLKELEKEVAIAKRETLRKIIEMEEAERRHLVEFLRESVNQRLAACKIMIESERRNAINTSQYEEVGASISDIIRELNQVCQDLTPTEIEILGLTEAAHLYVDKLAKRHLKTIDFVSDDNRLENLGLKDQFLVFRILQNFISVAVECGAIHQIEVIIHYSHPYMNIKFLTDAEVLLEKTSKEYHAIACRVDYYAGKISGYFTAPKHVMEIEFSITEIQ